MHNCKSYQQLSSSDLQQGWSYRGLRCLSNYLVITQQLTLKATKFGTVDLNNTFQIL